MTGSGNEARETARVRLSIGQSRGRRVTGVGMMFTASEILSATGGRLMRGDPSLAVPSISIDSRTVQPGELFIALRGERFDGHRFIYDAMGRGACGVVVNVSDHRMPETDAAEGLLRDKVIIGVTYTVAALQDMARFHRDHWGRPAVVITGSNGKTTTKEMAASILSQRYVTLKTEGNLNNHIGLPLTLLRLTGRHQIAVLEMGISRHGELRRLAETAMPNIGLVTNIGPAHLEGLGGVQDVAKAKAELLEELPPSEGVAILNRDDPFYSYLQVRAKGRLVTFGLNPGSDVCIESLEETESQATMTLTCQPPVFGIGLPPAKRGRLPGRLPRVRIQLSLIGWHNAMNAAAAAAAGLVMGCDLKAVKDGLEEFRPMAMRSELIAWEGRSILNDAYNANPASMQAALGMLGRFPGHGHRIAVLGDMRELGAGEADAHRQIGQAAVSCGVTFLITMGALAEGIAEGALAEGMDRSHVMTCRDTAQVARVLTDITRNGDVILIKGSRAMRMEQILNELGLRG